ncbi:MAG: DUF4383 domain-containing protein [Pseudonocardiaceae bacterium]
MLADTLAATRGRTTVLVTHNLSGLDGVDEILVLGTGSGTKPGTPTTNPLGRCATATWEGMGMTVDAEAETTFGIKPEMRLKSLAQKYSLLAGVFYLALAVTGFWTGSSSGTGMNDMLFGVFMVNPFHNFIHLAVGLLWLMGAFVLTADGAEGLNLALGSFWVLATVLGFLGYLSALAVMSGTMPDTFLHLGTAVATLLFGTGLLRSLGGGDRAAIA